MAETHRKTTLEEQKAIVEYYQACPMSPTGIVESYDYVDFTDPSQLYPIN